MYNVFFIKHFFFFIQGNDNDYLHLLIMQLRFMFDCLSVRIYL